MEIPLGLFFQPFDYDLVRFLFEFVTGTNNSEGLIHEEDIFGDKEPWELIRYGPSENMAYFLTKLKKKGKLMTARRVERTVGKKVKGKKPGNWHGQDKGKPVFDEKGKYVMGYKRCFVYKNRTEPEQDGQWLMKEFSLPETIVKKARAKYPIVEERKDFVLCRVERKKDDEDEDDEKTSQIMAPSPAGDTDIISSYLDGVPVPVPAGDMDIISSYLDGVPVPAGDTDMSSYLVDVPMETLIVPGETLLAAPADRDQETFPEPGSSSFMDFIFNMEDVTRLIDFDF
nr:NAC domain-containing protein [Ipomoea batatas]